MIELAVGVILGTAFSNVIQSLVDDIVTPPFGLLIGGVDFANLTVSIPNFVYQNQPPVVIRYGKFIQALFSLVIVAFALFFIIKSITKLKRVAKKLRSEEEESKKNELSEESKLLKEIRDILAWKSYLTEEITL